MPILAITNFNVVITLLGGWVIVFGLFSRLLIDRFFLSEAFISFFAGAFFTHIVEVIRPLEYVSEPANIDVVTLDFTRLVLGVQLVLAGVQLPSRYLRTEWRPLALLLGPGMLGMWACTTLLVYLLIPGLPVLGALALAACVTPTDPVLSNTILRGRFAEENVSVELRNIITAESGGNDGLGYGFLFLALYLLEVFATGTTSSSPSLGAVAGALGRWLGEACLYVVLLSVVYGWTVGWAARRALQWAEKRKWVDREGFFVFAIALALLLVGSCGMVGTDDVLACFVAGNAFTWDDWFRLRTRDDSLQPNVDNLLNTAVFMWLGAVCPWASFVRGDLVPVWRLFLFGALVIALRRLPTILALYRYVPQLENLRQAVFVGYFGPIGVSAIFYLFVTLEFLDNMAAKADSGEGTITDTDRLKEIARLVVWFLTICSIVIHGLSIPLSKLWGIFLPGRPTQPIMLPE